MTSHWKLLSLALLLIAPSIAILLRTRLSLPCEPEKLAVIT